MARLLINMDTTSPVQQAPQEYFLGAEDKSQKKKDFYIWWKKFWQAFQYYARQVWPYINRLISFLVYETIKAVKGIVKIGLQQVGMFKD